jgi:hypothetical protein
MYIKHCTGILDILSDGCGLLDCQCTLEHVVNNKTLNIVDNNLVGVTEKLRYCCWRKDYLVLRESCFIAAT